MQSYEAASDLMKDRVVLVTGASDGIGRVAALTLAAHGATVILLGRVLEKLDAVYDEIVAAGHPTPAILTLDLSMAGEHECRQLAEVVETTFGRLDGVLHNAAVLGDITPLEMYDPDTWDFVMKVNLRAPFVLTQALLPLLKQSPDASVVMTTSSVGRRARAFWGAYAISKCGIEGMVQMLADELANVSSIRVNAINPGATRTNMRASAYPGENPDGVTRPEALMPLYLYLLGPDSQGITGQSFDAQPPKAAS
ncbi:YciK family oxidoreductase [Perlucidibaca piscinae]|uniref:YciK family oxidoreductase n=1 Tax=Perlucidibaca piscinae TaxID=392589 RepID=UPI0003B34470|nr:YciK family oxidoreductase [Perlucidibaca piscinae]